MMTMTMRPLFFICAVAATLCHIAVADSASFSQPHEREALATSPPVYPPPWMDPNAPGWEDAYAKAKAFVSKLTVLEKVNLTTGVG